MKSSTIVVGGGLAGLTAAHTLAEGGEEVLLLEAADRPGGVIRTEAREGYLLEEGPNTVRPSTELWRLVQKLGLTGEVLLADPRSPRYIDFGGKLHKVPMSPPQLATTRLLSPGGKLRILAEPLRGRGRDPEESVRDFFARRLGPEVADRLVEPFVGGIFAGSASDLVMSAAFPTLFRWERERGSLLRGSLANRKKTRASPALPSGLVSFQAGLEALPRALARSLGARYCAKTSVTSVAPHAAGWKLGTNAGELEAPRVIVATPAPRAAELVRAFAPEAAAALSAVPHPPLAILHLAWPDRALRKPLIGFGHLVAPSPQRRILGAVWSSSLFAGRAPQGHALLTVYLGGTRDPKAPSLSDSRLTELATRDLEAEGLVQGPPEFVRITRWSQAIPQYSRGHLARMDELARTEARFPGLRFLGSYRGGISVADVIRNAMEV